MASEGETASKEAARHSFQVLDRIFSILELFTEQKPEWTTTEVSRELGLPVPTVYRILTGLRTLEYVHQDGDSKRYRLGIAALRLGDRARAVVDLRAVALPVLEEIARETGETALLTVPSSSREASVCLERVETSHPLRLSVQPGRQLPLHAGASQKALLAFMPQTDIERVLQGRLEQLCTATITDPERLRNELGTIRDCGWASSYEETNVGVWGVAVPVLERRQGAICAVGIAGPSARLSTGRISGHIKYLHAAAARIAKALGLVTPDVKVRTKEALKPRPGR